MLSNFKVRVVVAVLAGVTCALVEGDVSTIGKAAGGPTKNFTLVYTVNNAGYIDVCGCKHKEVRQGSLTRRASFLKQLRATGRDLLLVDGGSSLFALEDRVKESELTEALRKAELIIEAYNRMGYRAMAVGSFDIAGGLENLKNLEKKAKFTFLSANLTDRNSNKLYFTPYIIVEARGARVGVIGITLETMGKAYLAKVAPDAVITDPIEATKKCLDELRGKVDVVVSLSHLREETNFELLDKLKEIEILVDPFIQYGNHHTWIKEEEWFTSHGDTLLLRGDGQGARMGIVDLQLVTPRTPFVLADRKKELEDLLSSGKASAAEKEELEKLRDKNLVSFQRISLEPHHKTDPEIDLLIEEWKKNIDPSKVAKFEVELPHKADFLTVEKCKSCHEKQYENWKTTKHSGALASLAATGDEHRYDCVGCHSVGYGEAFLDTSKIGAYANVQCESCHGTNTKHAEDPKKFTFPKVARSDCIVCHNKEQTREDFNFYQAKPKVQCPKA